jgi:hypothetical protein
LVRHLREGVVCVCVSLHFRICQLSEYDPYLTKKNERYLDII